MKRLSARAALWVATISTGSFVAQTGGCAVNGDQNALLSEIVLRQLTNLISDTVFFVLDNALVRLSV